MNNDQILKTLLDLGNEFLMRASGATFPGGIPNDKCKTYQKMIDQMYREISDYNDNLEKIKAESLERKKKEKEEWLAEHEIVGGVVLSKYSEQ